jgi:hypothetical protein
VFDELGVIPVESSSVLDPVTKQTGASLWGSAFGSDALQRDNIVDGNLKIELVEKTVSNKKYIEMQVCIFYSYFLLETSANGLLTTDLLLND